jgi:hypothetical protein
LLLKLSKQKNNCQGERGAQREKRETTERTPPKHHPTITTARTPTQPPQELHPTTTTATITHPQPNFQPLPKIKRKTDWEGEKEKNQARERK